MATPAADPELYRFPEFFPLLEGRGLMRVRDAVESETEVDGLVYHHRGVQLPATDVIFVWNPDGRESPTFRVDVDGIGPRRASATFDATANWDVFLLLFDGGAVVAWMSDAEFEAEEAGTFPTKAGAIEAGRFSFATFFLFGPDWVEREEWARSSAAPALLQLGDGRMISPETPEAFYEAEVAIPEELRPGDAVPPGHLSVIGAELIVTEGHGQPRSSSAEE